MGASGDCSGCAFDGLRDFRIQSAQACVGGSGGCLDVRQSPDERRGHRLVTDREILNGTLGLCAVEGIIRYLYSAHAVGQCLQFVSPDAMLPTMFRPRLRKDNSAGNRWRSVATLDPVRKCRNGVLELIPPLCGRSALELQALIASREISCTELLDVHLDWIATADASVHAICTLVPDMAREAARTADARLAGGAPARALEGLPVAIKDLVDTAGIRTTYGSPLFKDHVPNADALHVQRLKAAGAIVIGKTNTPEWGAGSQTFNALFETTATPYDLTCTAGGSSGGAAAALAARMLPIADGSDLGGSLRNPAAFCNVVGLRPTPGRVPNVPDRIGWSPLSVLGPWGARSPMSR